MKSAIFGLFFAALFLIIQSCSSPESQFNLKLRNSTKCATMAAQRIQACKRNWDKKECGLKNDLDSFETGGWRKPENRPYKMMCIEGIRLAWENQQYSEDTLSKMHQDRILQRKEYWINQIKSARNN